MPLSPLDRLLVRRILSGSSSAELAKQLGLSVTQVEQRASEIFRHASSFSNRALPDVEHRRLAALLRLWDIRRGRRIMPAHGTLTITDLQPWIDHVAIMEMTGHPPQPKARVEGRALVTYMRGDISGRYIVDCVPEEAYPLAVAPFTQAATTHQPQYDVLSSRREGWKHLRYHRLLLPHTTNGRDVDIVLAVGYVEAEGKPPEELPDEFYRLHPRKVA